MPLSVAPIGAEVKIRKVAADEKTRRHLENLGFVQGAGVTALAESGGNIIVRVKDARLALSKGVATRIFVA